MQNGETAPVAVIVGGGRGMGAAIARELSSRHYRLCLMSPSDSAIRLAEELDGVGLQGGAESLADLERLAAAATDRFGRIDAVVNLTGHPPTGPLLELADEVWEAVNESVVLSVQRMARLATPVMLAQGKGAFVNITTLAAFEPDHRYPISCAYRAAVGAYTKMYSDLYGPKGIRMNALLPGYIDSMEHTPESLAGIPLQRAGSVQEIARTAAFLLSDDAGYITGQNIRVDGGLTRHV